MNKSPMIELKPITLLFGPNSAGKSTILQALHYVREILERGNIDPDVTIASPSGSVTTMATGSGAHWVTAKPAMVLRFQPRY